MCFPCNALLQAARDQEDDGRLSVYIYMGLVMFLTGVNFGFAPVGQSIGHVIAEGEYKWLLIPIGAIIGYYIVQAEPAVHVLNNQVEEITGGTVTKKMMNLASLRKRRLCRCAFDGKGNTRLQHLLYPYTGLYYRNHAFLCLFLPCL